MLSKKINFFIIFVILLIKDKIVCYYLNVTNIYTYNFNKKQNFKNNFNQKENFIKNIAYNLYAFA